MKIAVLSEASADEARVAISPAMIKRLVGHGASVVVQAGAGLGSRVLDTTFVEAGATIGKTAPATLKGSDVVLCVRRPNAAQLKSIPEGALLLGMLEPYGDKSDLDAMAKAGISAFSMELMPRITRAQVMDVLSSQANLAGYQAVIDAAGEFDRAMPMMMTAAGTIPAARVFVMGAGVAGLQAIATARRLGAVVSATDVRPAAKEQVESLGGKFIAVENDEFKQAETSGGYAKEMSDDYKKQQADLVATHMAKQDIVITTALIPGRPAPRLISKEMITAMRPGSILIDLAVERGGNVEGSKAGEIVEVDGKKIVGHKNVPGRIAATASELYAKNLASFLETMIDKESGELAVDWEDELVTATLLTRDGAVVHPNFSEKA
ncbi:MAG: Re/Si-specific NAD(P)(+) transhydrogenase subunit alpha [Hyphomicrobiales bacterium]